MIDYSYLTKRRIITDVLAYIICIYLEIKMIISVINGCNINNEYITIYLVAAILAIPVFLVTKDVIKLNIREKQTKSFMKIFLYLYIILSITYLLTTCALTAILIYIGIFAK